MASGLLLLAALRLGVLGLVGWKSSASSAPQAEVANAIILTATATTMTTTANATTETLVVPARHLGRSGGIPTRGGASGASSSSFPPSCPAVRGGMASRVACRDWLHAHNNRRQTFHAQQGHTPRHVVWDTALADSAAAYATTLAASCVRGALPHSNQRGMGENLAYNAGGNGLPLTPEQVMTYWWDAEYKLAQQKSKPTLHDIGHFTAAAWYKTERIGCATASLGSCGHYHVCHYQGAGNCNVGGEWHKWKTFIFDNPVCP